MVSDSGGTAPVWSPDGDELFYRRSESFSLNEHESENPLAELKVVQVTAEQNFSLEKPKILLRRHGTNYDIAPDGKQFIQVDRQATELKLTVNWKSILIDWEKKNSRTDASDSMGT